MNQELNKYFARWEFACKCGCGQDTVDAELLDVLTRLRKHFNEPTTISSGNRCIAYNDKVGGTWDSQHLLGKAADIFVNDIAASRVREWLETNYPYHYGIGNYDTRGFTHIDARGLKARW